MPNAMLKMSWKTSCSGSGDRLKFHPITLIWNNDRSRRNAFVFLVDVFATKRTHSGRRSLHYSCTEGRSNPGAHWLGRVPGQPGSKRDLQISDRRVRVGGLVGGRRSRG